MNRVLICWAVLLIVACSPTPQVVRSVEGAQSTPVPSMRSAPVSMTSDGVVSERISVPLPVAVVPSATPSLGVYINGPERVRVAVDSDEGATASTLSFNLTVPRGGEINVVIPRDILGVAAGTVEVARHDSRWNDWNLVASAMTGTGATFAASESGSYRVSAGRSSIVNQLVFPGSSGFTGTPTLEGVDEDFAVKNVVTTNRVWVVYVHGSGSERVRPHYRWDPFLGYLRGSSQEALAYRGSFTSLLFHYDSRQPIEDNAVILRNLIRQKVKDDSYILVAHSMGGLVARTAYVIDATPDRRENCLGVIALGTPHHGSPLAIPDWLWALFSRQDLGRLKFNAYLAYLNDFYGDLDLVKGKRLGEMLANGVNPVVNLGERDLAFDGGSPGIPTVMFPLFSKSFLVADGLSPVDKHQSIRGVGISSASTTKWVAVAGHQYYNYPEALAAYQSSLSTRPYLIAYGGYYPSLQKSIGDRNEFVDFSIKSLENVALRQTRSFEDRGLQWAAGIIASLPVVSSDDRSSFFLNDGLVPLESALFLRDGESVLHSRSTTAVVEVNRELLLARKNPCVIEQRVYPINHREIVEGESTENGAGLFTQLTRDILELYHRADVAPPALTGDDTSAMRLLLTSKHHASGWYYRVAWTSERDIVVSYVVYDGSNQRLGFPKTDARFHWQVGRWGFVGEEVSTTPW